jgi:hypothetical protein
MKFLLLVVLYKKLINESKTISSLKNCLRYYENSTIFIWDNSPDKQDFNELYLFTKSCGVHLEYYHEPVNRPLSYVYNTIIDRYIYKEIDYLILFDDDSSFNSYFFISLKDAINNYPDIMLFIPTIRYKDRFVSPTRKYFLKGFYIKKRLIGKIRSGNISAINSGMTISFSFFESGFSYDERLKFYGTDDYFMSCYSQRSKYLVVINYILSHTITLSTLNKFSEKLLHAYKEMTEAWKIIYIKNRISFLVVYIYIYVHKFVTSIKYKNFSFFLK